MESLSPVIDLESLLQPISDDAPSGESVQYSGVYDEIREARRADDNLSKGEWAWELKVADWRQVIDLTTTALMTQTKDLQVGAWLAEALVKRHGFVGLRDSLQLMRGFHENFWEGVYPEIDEGDDLEARANALEFMDKQTSFAVKEIALTAGDGLSYINWEESKRFDIPENIEALDSAQQEKYVEMKREAEEHNRTTGEMWRKAKNQSRRAFYEQLNLTLEECWSEFEQLDRKIDDCFGNQTPGLNALKKSLDQIRDLVKKLLQEKREQEPDASGETSLVTTDGNGSAIETVDGNGTYYAVPGAANGAVRNRHEALKRLSEVADFFRQTEPHSPVSYLVQRAVKWGNMPLELWLQDVVKDTMVLGQIKETLGIESQAENGDYSSSNSESE